MSIFLRKFWLLTFTTTSALSQTQNPVAPRTPFDHWGACPFECCTYREWQATEPVVVYSERNIKSPVAFELRQDEWVRALTGVIVTSKLGVAKVVNPRPPLSSVGPADKLPLGDTIYLLHADEHAGMAYWYRGKVYSDEIERLATDGLLHFPAMLKIDSMPEYEWWARIQNRAGRRGWTIDIPKFTHLDACG